ncbi:MAG TPA: ATP-binding cassette domain-containing protein [bacterium]|nr:ATP-binding cassette domain-containing protein [bacterium]HOL47081.1 ATP-binding cassette domain-containing protein [bacterium]HPQ18981.1 ATP-binding cassette domain-containing protein [bacterium]
MIRVSELNFNTDKFELKNISIEILDDDYFVLLGPSGSGKTTLAKCICGFYKIKKGKIIIDEKDITNKLVEDRMIGYVPQNYALFPNMKVQENILFGIKMRKIKFQEIKNKFEELIKILKLENLLFRSVENLSGGEKQRVALARALIIEPKFIILDEPFSAIDIGLKKSLWFEIKEIIKIFKIPVMHITHNLDEAALLGNKIAILINGEIIQYGNQNDVFNKPKNENVAKYLGYKNIFAGKVIDTLEDKIIIQSEKLRIIANNEGNKYHKGDEVKFSIRAQDIKIIKENFPIREELKDNLYDGEIISAYFLFDTCILLVRSVVDFELIFPIYIYHRHSLFIGKKIKIGIWLKGISIFEK